MKPLSKLLIVILASLAIVCASCQEQSSNSFSPGQIWLDNNATHINAHGGGILTHNNTYYWFGEHKVAGKAGNKAKVGIRCYSSNDLYNWIDEGIALNVSDDPDSDITKGCILERPKVIYNQKTKKFVMWFHLELKGQGYNAARAGVAISDNVTGPYEFINSFRPNAGHWPINLDDKYKVPLSKEELKNINFTGGPNEAAKECKVLRRDFKGGQMSRDMNLFVDDDQKAYHIFASEENGTLHISQLTDDYIFYAGKYVRAFENRWMEAPAICKRNGKYYLVMSGCTGWAPNAARSAVAESMFGPWKELGNPCIGKNADTTFGGQSTCIVKVLGKEDAYVAFFDIWRPENAIDGRYMPLPINFTDDDFKIEYFDKWDLSYFD